MLPRAGDGFFESSVGGKALDSLGMGVSIGVIGIPLTRGLSGRYPAASARQGEALIRVIVPVGPVDPSGIPEGFEVESPRPGVQEQQAGIMV